MVILHLIGIVISLHCASTWGSEQSFSQWNNGVEEGSATEEQPEVIETAGRLEVVCAWENGLLDPWEAKQCA